MADWPEIEALTLPLFVPGHRPDRFAKAAAAAEAVIVDLEDAVPVAEKAAARAGLAAALGRGLAVPVLVRVNAAGTAWHADDLAACAGLPLAGIVLPKAETAAGVASATAATGLPVLALVESAAGLVAVQDLARAAARLAFGSIDYAADIGADHSVDALLHARSALVVAARAAGRPAPLDGVTAAVGEAARVEADSRYARSLGMGGKLLIHPAQVGHARRGFAPTPEEVAEARRILAAAAAEGGAVRVDGAMVDAPVVKRAAQVLACAAAAEA